MTKITLLQNKIQVLEARVKELEVDQEFDNQMFKLAQDLVAKYGKSSVIFLQQKLLIDHHRATNIHDRLEREKQI